MADKDYAHNIPLNKELLYKMARDILSNMIQFRAINNNYDDGSLPCLNCFESHIPKIVNSIEKGQPIRFVLPAFPGKSPNPQKVIGPLPDRAERHSLKFLNDLCKSIQNIYHPGAKILICSDGRVFSNVVGVKDSDITAYQKEIDAIIRRDGFTCLSTFHLDQIYEGDSFESMRQDLLEEFGKPISLLKEMVSRGNSENASREDKEAHRLYNGISRFLFEDSLHLAQLKSRSSLKKDAKKRAYNVIQLSNAWSELIAKKFPEHVRLSIHPQTCGDKKIGIKLSTESTVTPWHGVALNTNGKIIFVKQSEAEKLNARLVFDENGRPDYYEI